jgi:hypothetical protein
MTGLNKGSVFKSTTCGEGETFYTIILKRRLLFPKYCKTATIYKNWEDDSSKLEVFTKYYDSRDYSNETRRGNMKSCNEEEIKQLKGYIEDLPPKIQRKIYSEIEFKLSIVPNDNFRYGFEMQNISRIEEMPNDISRKTSYKKKFSVI